MFRGVIPGEDREAIRGKGIHVSRKHNLDSLPHALPV
jgi:hypothetical protein